MSEIAHEGHAAHLFVGKTIQKMDVRCCNNLEFLFTDGSRVAIHIDVNCHGLPVLAACTSCVEITAGESA